MPETKKVAKKLGRPEVLSTEDLQARLKALKRFLEDNWSRIGLELRKVHHPDHVLALLKLVPGVEWCAPFRDHAAACLLNKGATPVGWREIRLTRRQYKEANDILDRSWTEYHSAQQKAQEAITAFKATISQFVAGIDLFPFFVVVALAANELGVKELTDTAVHIGKLLASAQKDKQTCEEKLLTQESWYARNEVVRFVRSRRYDKTPINLAQAMAGLPEYGWLHSLRKCSRIVDNALASSSSFNYQLFELLRTIVRKVKPLNLGKIEMMFRNELLRQDTDQMLRSYVSPSWGHMEQAFADCRKQHYKRAEVTYKIMARFLDITEGPKSIAGLELAKRRQLV